MYSINLLPNALSEMFAQVSDSGKITLADRYGLLAAILDSSISEEEMRFIDRMLYAVHRRRVIIVNELSAICSRH